MRVLIYSSDKAALSRLDELISSSPAVTSTHIAHERGPLFVKYGRHGADVVLFDTLHGSVHTISLVRELLSTHPEALVLTIGSPIDIGSVAATIASGARGLLSAGASEAEVIVGLAQVAQHLTTDSEEPQVVLGGRQLQILRGISEGQTYGEIGRKLMLSELTVQQEARKILRALGARDKTHGVAQAFRRGLLD